MENKRIPSELVNQIISNSNIVEIISEFISLSKKGNNYIGLCPFHEDSSPSFTISPQKQIFKCFPCGASGNVISFLEKIKNWNFIQSLEFLAQKQGIEFDFTSFKNDDKTKYYSQETVELVDILSIANYFYKVEVLKSTSANEYLKKRKLDDLNIREKFDIGYAPKNKIVDYLKKLGYDSNLMLKAGLINSELNELFWDRITFGIRNEYGDLVGFSGRTLDSSSTSKYVNSPATHLFNKSKILYNFNNAKDNINSKKEVIIVEGFMDAIALDKAGIHNVVALMGTALTKEHLNLIKRNKVILFLDNDTAGIEATLRTLKLLLENGFSASVINNTYLKDADEILNNYGKETLIDLINNNQVSSVNFIYEKLKAKHKVDQIQDYESFSKFIQILQAYINLFNDEQKEYISSLLSKEFNYSLKYQLKENQNIYHEIPQKQNIDFRNTQWYRNKIELLANQNRLSLLIRAMSNQYILEIIKATNDVSLLFTKPDSIKNLYEYTIQLNEVKDPNEIYKMIYPELNIMLNSIDYNDEINAKIIKEYVNDTVLEANKLSSFTIPLQPYAIEQVAEWEKYKNILYAGANANAVPPFIQDQISLLINKYKNRKLIFKNNK
ncbi:DNA primase [Mycoplasmopsis verecunda]|uniref:DNA primase n=1 Tax=Mycoplasmopsis verecunda TaxID=171291 RepID=A0A1T4KJY4_9BACT|nr:DNA primase [Mycoplasmopsis verecunda]WPB54256.1 DNA primase [Mycoplasmopsis verecunda]SJZ42714.1 DNA primase [Mycoplasmopsis verecunda]